MPCPGAGTCEAPDSRLPPRGFARKTVAREVGGRARKRRKEVALGRLRTLTILLTLGAWGAATEGAPPGDAATPTDRDAAGGPARARRRLPQGRDPPVQHGRPGQRRQVSQGRQRLPRPAPARRAGPARRLPGQAEPRPGRPGRPAGLDAAGLGRRRPRRRPPAPAPAGDARPAAGAAARGRPPTSSRRPAGSSRRPASRCGMGNYDEATRIVAEVQKMDVKWGLFDETPAKLAEAIAKARPKMAAGLGRRRPRQEAGPGQAQGGPRPAGQQPVRAGRGDRAGGQLVGPLLQRLGGQARQGRRRRPGPPQARRRPATPRPRSSRAWASTTSWSARPAT